MEKDKGRERKKARKVRIIEEKQRREVKRKRNRREKEGRG